MSHLGAAMRGAKLVWVGHCGTHFSNRLFSRHYVYRTRFGWWRVARYKPQSLHELEGGL